MLQNLSSVAVVIGALRVNVHQFNEWVQPARSVDRAKKYLLPTQFHPQYPYGFPQSTSHVIAGNA